MNELFNNFKASFGAKYVAEDAASNILYSLNRSFLDGRAVAIEELAHKAGFNVLCDYITGDCTEALGTVVFEPQKIDTVKGALKLTVPTFAVERDIIDRGESGLYNLTLAFMFAEALFYYSDNGYEDNGQLSFGFSEIESLRKKEISIKEHVALMDEENTPANFALKLALPKSGFKKQTLKIYSSLGVNRATLSDKHLPEVAQTLAERYNVPVAAALVRMRELNLF